MPPRFVQAPPRTPAAKSSSCWVYHADGTPDGGGGERNDMRDVDRELGLLEQSNAALFKALAQTRTMPASRLPPTIDGEICFCFLEVEFYAGTYKYV